MCEKERACVCLCVCVCVCIIYLGNMCVCVCVCIYIFIYIYIYIYIYRRTTSLRAWRLQSAQWAQRSSGLSSAWRSHCTIYLKALPLLALSLCQRGEEEDTCVSYALPLLALSLRQRGVIHIYTHIDLIMSKREIYNAYIHTYKQTNIHTYIHTNKHTYIHTYVC